MTTLSEQHLAFRSQLVLEVVWLPALRPARSMLSRPSYKPSVQSKDSRVIREFLVCSPAPSISVLISLIVPDTTPQTSLKQPSNMMEYAACTVVLAPQSWGTFQQWPSTSRCMMGLRRASENLRWAKCRSMTEYTLLHNLRATSPSCATTHGLSTSFLQ